MAGLGALMVSDASYPAVPTVGFRSLREILGTIVVLGTIIGVFFVPKQFFFPACLAYVLYGLGRSVLLGLLGRPTVSNHDADLDSEEDDDTDIEPLDRPATATLAYSPSETTQCHQTPSSPASSQARPARERQSGRSSTFTRNLR